MDKFNLNLRVKLFSNPLRQILSGQSGQDLQLLNINRRRDYSSWLLQNGYYFYFYA